MYVCSEESNWSAEEEDGSYSVRMCMCMCAVRRATGLQKRRIVVSVRMCMCAVRRATGRQRKRRMVRIVCVCSLCAVRRVTSHQNVRVCMYVWQTVGRKLSFNVQRENDLNHKIVSSKVGQK